MKIFMELFFPWIPVYCGPMLCRTSISTSHSCDGNIGAELLPKKKNKFESGGLFWGFVFRFKKKKLGY